MARRRLAPVNPLRLDPAPGDLAIAAASDVPRAEHSADPLARLSPTAPIARVAAEAAGTAALVTGTAVNVAAGIQWKHTSFIVLRRS